MHFEVHIDQNSFACTIRPSSIAMKCNGHPICVASQRQIFTSSHLSTSLHVPGLPLNSANQRAAPGALKKRCTGGDRTRTRRTCLSVSPSRQTPSMLHVLPVPQLSQMSHVMTSYYDFFFFFFSKTKNVTSSYFIIVIF